MEHNYSYECLRVVLKPLTINDIEELRILRNKEAQFFLDTKQISKESQAKWFAKYLEKSNDIMFVVSKKDNPDVFIGVIAAYDIDFDNKVCEIGRTLIDKEKAPEKGIGTDATKAICSFCFNVLKMKRIIGVALKSNERILKVDSRVGFRIIGDYNENSYLMEMTQENLNLD